MSKSYIIQWESLINGRRGKGTKIFGPEEARHLAEELNDAYPDIHHEAIEAGGEPEPVTQPIEQEAGAQLDPAPDGPQVLQSPAQELVLT